MLVMLSVRLTRTGKEVARPMSVRVELDMDREGRALALLESGGGLRLERARVNLVSKDGLLISGFERWPEKGRDRFCYQEWWCRPVGEEG